MLMTHGVRAKHADESRDGASQRLKALEQMYQDGLTAADDGASLPPWALNETDFRTESNRVMQNDAKTRKYVPCSIENRIGEKKAICTRIREIRLGNTTERGLRNGF